MCKARLNDNNEFDGYNIIYGFFKKWKDVFLVANKLHTSLNYAHISKTRKYKGGSNNHETVRQISTLSLHPPQRNSVEGHSGFVIFLPQTPSSSLNMRNYSRGTSYKAQCSGQPR